MSNNHELFSRTFSNLNRNRGLFLFLFAILTAFFGLISDYPIALYGLFSGLIFFFISLVYFSKYITWNLGAKGEEAVIDELKKLDKDFFVLNDVRLPNTEGNIDHIVIGKNGIFVIETKNHKGNIKYENGKWTQEKMNLKGGYYVSDLKNPIKQADRNAVRLKEFISEKNIFSEKFKPWINTIVVFTNPDANLQIEKTQSDIVKIGDLCKVIENKKNRIRLEKNEIDKILNILESNLSSERKISSFEDVGESGWFKNYLKYIKFGFFWGIFYAISVTIVAGEFEVIDTWLFGILFNGVIMFLLGKAIIDLLKIRIKNDFIRLSATHFISYMPVFLLSLYFSPLEDPIFEIAELITRFVIVFLTFKVYRFFNLRLPS
ncbi:MAG: nuclease-related domain-containing protein [Candidatus Aenigmatarchaeota archaeon]